MTEMVTIRVQTTLRRTLHDSYKTITDRNSKHNHTYHDVITFSTIKVILCAIVLNYIPYRNIMKENPGST